MTAWIEEHGATWKSEAAARPTSSALPSSDIAIATGGAMPIPALQVDLSSADPAVEAARRAKERADAEAKRAQNALPEWLQKSTVSGESTGLGRSSLREQQLAEADAEETAKAEQQTAADCECIGQVARLTARSTLFCDRLRAVCVAAERS